MLNYNIGASITLKKQNELAHKINLFIFYVKNCLIMCNKQRKQCAKTLPIRTKQGGCKVEIVSKIVRVYAQP